MFLRRNMSKRCDMVKCFRDGINRPDSGKQLFHQQKSLPNIEIQKLREDNGL